MSNASLLLIGSMVTAIACLAIVFLSPNKGQQQSKKENKENRENREFVRSEEMRPLSKKCMSCGAVIDIHDTFCKYCGSQQNIVSSNGYSYTEQVTRTIDEAKIKEVEYKKEELKHRDTWWQRMLFMILTPIGIFALFVLFAWLIHKLF